MHDAASSWDRHGPESWEDLWILLWQTLSEKDKTSDELWAQPTKPHLYLCPQTEKIIPAASRSLCFYNRSEDKQSNKGTAHWEAAPNTQYMHTVADMLATKPLFLVKGNNGLGLYRPVAAV